MYKEHPCFEEPEDQKIKVWRYMDFYKFVSILGYNSLFFPNIKNLEKFKIQNSKYKTQNTKQNRGTVLESVTVETIF